MTTPSKKKRKAAGGSTVVKSKKVKTSGKKKISTPKKGTVKAAVKSGVVSKLRARNAKGTVGFDLSPYAMIKDPVYELFDDPDDAPTSGGYRGCKKVTATLGPKQQFGQAGSDATGSYPKALAKASSTYKDQTFISGHVLNADFGGPNLPRNTTILTSSANGQQKTFDSNIKAARNALHLVYSTLAQCGPKASTFFTNLGYGIKIVITLDDDAWADDYPGNCISTEMRLTATVVNEAKVTAAAADTSKFNNAVPSKLNGIAGQLQNVQNLVDTANTGNVVDNREY